VIPKSRRRDRSEAHRAGSGIPWNAVLRPGDVVLSLAPHLRTDAVRPTGATLCPAGAGPQTLGDAPDLLGDAMAVIYMAIVMLVALRFIRPTQMVFRLDRR
jgi:hypothetical protein